LPSASSRKVGGRGVAVTVGVAVGVAVFVGTRVFVSIAVAVGDGVFVGKGVLVGRGVFVGAGVAVGVTPHAARAKPMDDVPHNLKKSRRVNWIIVFSLRVLETRVEWATECRQTLPPADSAASHPRNESTLRTKNHNAKNARRWRNRRAGVPRRAFRYYPFRS
jgi:carbonic anhydrase/acetyltransferase-like protein (isoleucine patch superfamily)